MGAAAQAFRGHLAGHPHDEEVAEMRRNLCAVKRTTLERVTAGAGAEVPRAMETMYEEIVTKLIQLSSHVGTAVAYALEAYDELAQGCSISRFDREQREPLTALSAKLKRRHASRIARAAAEIEAQRMAWRDSHELLSWLMFRRGQEGLAAGERLARFEEFSLSPKLLGSREAIVRRLGAPLTAAVEAHDRFMLANRWREGDDETTRLEQASWGLLSYQPPLVLRVEQLRQRYDALERSDADRSQRVGVFRELVDAFADQLAWSLDGAPSATSTPVL
ncbi:MAG: hypothetical protein B7733_13315 [Myxococcales bacterium FL481]|nr:MAG: hypothetical protein B7733_13315 [Myxococcales bacterium FL481]